MEARHLRLHFQQLRRGLRLALFGLVQQGVTGYRAVSRCTESKTTFSAVIVISGCPRHIDMFFSKGWVTKDGTCGHVSNGLMHFFIIVSQQAIPWCPRRNPFGASRRLFGSALGIKDICRLYNSSWILVDLVQYSQSRPGALGIRTQYPIQTITNLSLRLAQV